MTDTARGAYSAVLQVEAELLAAAENYQLIQHHKAQLEQQLAEQQQVLQDLLELTPQVCVRFRSCHLELIPQMCVLSQLLPSWPRLVLQQP